VCLAEALRKAGHSSLRVLAFNNMQVDDREVQVLASLAMDKGKGLRNLVRQDLGRNKSITDVGAFALAKAIEGMGELFYFNVSFFRIAASGAAALVSALICHCHRIDEIHLPRVEEAARRAIFGIPSIRYGRGKEPLICFCRREEEEGEEGAEGEEGEEGGEEG
jgi:hypothetical protein